VLFDNFKLVKTNPKTVHGIVESGVPGLESVNPLDDEFYFIRRFSSQPIVDDADLIGLDAKVDDDLDLWTTLTLSKAREVLLNQKVYGRDIANATELVETANYSFDFTSPISLGHTLGNKFVSTKDLLEFLEALKSAAIPANPNIKDKKDVYAASIAIPDDVKEAAVKLVTNVYGSSTQQSLPLPIIFDGSYGELLIDMRYNVVRAGKFRNYTKGIKWTSPVACLRDVSITHQLAQYALERNLAYSVINDKVSEKYM